MKIRYLEKDNKDLEMDLDDVDATLSINKNLINALVDSRKDFNQVYKETIRLMQDEINVLSQRNKKLKDERESLKSRMLVFDQIQMNHELKEKELAQHFEYEKIEIVEQLEKKEYTLQLLEQRLFDVESFLWKMGREDPAIRDQLL